MFAECLAMTKFLYYNEVGFETIRTEKGFPARAGAFAGLGYSNRAGGHGYAVYMEVFAEPSA